MRDTIDILGGQQQFQDQILKPFDNSQVDTRRMAIAEKRRREGDDRLSKLPTLDAAKTHWKDYEMFAKGKDDLIDYATQNIDKLRAGDAMALMGYKKLYSDLMYKAGQSQHFREEHDRILRDAQEHPNKYRPETMEHLIQMGDASTSGQWQLDINKIKQNINLNDALNKQFQPEYDQSFKESKQGSWYPLGDNKYKKTEKIGLTKEQFEDRLRGFAHAPQNLDQISYEFERDATPQEKEKYTLLNGTTDPVKWFIDKKEVQARYKPIISNDNYKAVGQQEFGSDGAMQYSINSPGKGIISSGEGQNKAEYTQYGGGGVKKPLPVTMALPRGTISPTNNDPIVEADIIKNMSLGAPYVKPVFKKTGRIVSDDYIASMIDKNMNVGDEVEWMPFSEAVAEDGNLTETYFVPLSSVQNVYQQNKQNVSSFFKLADQLNGKKSTSKPAETKTATSAKSGIPKITTKEEYDSLPSGTEFLDANGVKRKKK